MEELEKLSYMYPSAITIIIVLIALLVLYVTGRSLAYVFETTEERVKSEPSIMTEYDRINSIEHRMKYDKNMLAEAEMYGDEITSLIKSHTDRVTKCYKERVEILEIANKRLEDHCNHYKDLIDSCMTTLRERDDRVIELEKELSDLRSSCDDSFLNTVERANQLSLKCASLENIIAEFDVYKKDTQQTYDTLKAEYDNKITEIDKLNKRIAEIEKSLNDAKAQIFGDLDWANYVATDADESIYAYHIMPEKLSDQWNTLGKYELISLYQAIILCGLEPKWSDANPTPVVFNPATADKHLDLSWVNWIAKDKSGNIWAYSDKPEKLSFFLG